MNKLGYHVSIAGGLHNAFEHAENLECETMQIFVGAPQRWDTTERSEENIEKFKKAHEESDVGDFLVHSSYLPNIASSGNVRNMSKKKLKEEAKIAHAIGAKGYNFHLGSNPDKEEGLDYIVDTLNRIAELTEKFPIKLILENDAGAGNKLGKNLKELSHIWENIESKERFGICIDTCHLFVAGTDIRKEGVLDKFLSDFDKQIGLDHLEWIHANDSKGDLGSNKDRHAHIGEGELGEETFENMLNHSALEDVPFILETPRTGNVEEDIQDIKTLRKLHDA